MALSAFRLTAVGALFQEIPPSSVKRDENTILVLWGARHGNRNPEQFLDGNRTWGHEGAMELNEIGRKQALCFGRELKQFVGSLSGNEFNSNEAKYFSSSANRCQQTLQLVASSFYCRGDFLFQVDDHLLRTYSLCPIENPHIKSAWDPINSDSLPHLSQKAKEKAELINYLAKHIPWDFKHLGVMAVVADNVMQMTLHQVEHPEWLRDEALKKEILTFAEIHQYACASYEPCGVLMSRLWISHILSCLEDALHGKGPKIVGYTSHTEVTLSVMKRIGIVKDELSTAAGFVLELRLKPSPSVRILCHDPVSNDSHTIYLTPYISKFADASDRDGFIPLQIFIEHVKPKTIVDWNAAENQR